MFLFLLLALQPGLGAGEASLWFGDALAAADSATLFLHTHTRVGAALSGPMMAAVSLL